MFCDECYIKQFSSLQITLVFRVELNMRNLLFLTLLTFTLHKPNKSMEIWKDKSYNFLDYDDFNTLDDKCAENEICQNSFEDLIKRKSKDFEDASLKNDPNEKKGAKIVPFYHSSRPMSCSCGIEFRVLDLGHQYYPRYLHTGVCKSDLCGGVYRCIEKHYKVRVLKQRDPRGPEIKTSVTFPENLKGLWQPELVTVTVACECSL